MKLILSSLALLLATGNFAHAADSLLVQNTANLSVPNIVVPTVKAAVSTGLNASTKNNVFSLGLKWNESSRHFSVAVPNAGKADLTVLGVQASTGLYITSIPQKIPASGSASVDALLVEAPGTQTDVSLLRVLTSGGEIVVEVNHTRELAAQYSAASLKWSVGAAAKAQTITLTMAPNTAVPTSVKALGGNTATLAALGAGKYSITVTPSSTAKEARFPVLVTFQPQLTGVATAISCEIAP